MQHHALHAPFGLFQVANYEEVSRRYISDIPDLAQEAPLPPHASRSPSSARAA